VTNGTFELSYNSVTFFNTQIDNLFCCLIHPTKCPHSTGSEAGSSKYSLQADYCIFKPRLQSDKKNFKPNQVKS